MNNIDIAVERPLLFLILIPALLLGIIPFLRIQKRRRASIKHLVPFILHLSLIFILSGLLAGITVTETTDERLSTKVVFVADVSDSNKNMKTQMNNLIRNVIDESDAEKDSFGIVLFANDVIKKQDDHEFDRDASDFLKYDNTDTTIRTDGTNIGAAISAANDMFPDDQKVNKKIIVLSDGLETLGDSVTVAKQLNEGIQVSGAYFNTVDPEGINREVQLVSVNTNGRVPQGGTVQVEFVIKSTKLARKAELKIEDGDIVTTKYVDLQPGENVVRMEYSPEKAGVNTICASVSVDSRSDLIEGNNVLYAWYSLDDKKTILIVDGDEDEDKGQFEQIKNSAVLSTLGDYTIKIVGPKNFPTSLEGLLDYDQVVLMDVNFDDLHSGAPSDLRRYVEEVGRGLFVSFGDNFYEMGKGEDGEMSEQYRELELEKILPVDLKLEGEKETVGMVLVVDLSSSMKDLMDGRSRFELVVEGVKKVLMLGATPEEKEKGEGFEDTDYVGVICFDSGAHVALEMKELGDIESREQICKDVEWELRHYYNWYYLNPDGTESDYPVTKDDGDTYTKLGYSYPSSDSKNPKGGYDQETNRAIRSYGTNYKWAIQEASDMLDDKNDEVMLHIKQVLFMSDGAPSDAGSGYVGIVERMANGGIKTSAIAAGLDLDASKQSKQKEELKKISNAGGGDFFVAETADALTNEIVEKAEEVTAQLINERNVLPMENSYNSSILQGIHSNEGENKFEIIGGYYTSTIKQGADLILYVDKMKPLYAEWQFGLGKVAVFMTDLGNEKWTKTLFDTDNGLKLVSNMMNATMNREVDSTGLEYEATRDGKTTTVTVNTPIDLRNGESLILQAKDKNGDVVINPMKFKQMAVKKYRASVTMDRTNDTYTLDVMLVDDKTGVIKDMTSFAVNGYYNKEYDVFVEGGEATIAGISTNGGGNMISDGDGFFDDIENKIQVFNHDVTTPVIIAALIIFLLDILFRNIVVKKKKDKQPEMTEEERLASMRGR